MYVLSYQPQRKHRKKRLTQIDVDIMAERLARKTSQSYSLKRYVCR